MAASSPTRPKAGRPSRVRPAGPPQQADRRHHRERCGAVLPGGVRWRRLRLSQRDGAPFYGSTGGLRLVKPVVSMTAASGGYYLVRGWWGVLVPHRERSTVPWFDGRAATGPTHRRHLELSEPGTSPNRALPSAASRAFAWPRASQADGRHGDDLLSILSLGQRCAASSGGGAQRHLVRPHLRANRHRAAVG